MRYWGKRAVSLLLILAMSLAAAPGLSVLAAEGDGTIYTLDNGYLTATVSGRNGGFLVRTTQGDKLVKDDDNKNLLFPDGEYDTSFTSIRVTRGNQVKEYIFGRDYPAAGSSKVETTQAEGAVRSVWSVDGLTFTQTIALAGAGSNEHGMTRISYEVRKQSDSVQDAQVELRILMDTALGYQDYAVYELSASDTSGRVEQEKVIGRGDEGFYRQSFFAYDDYRNPTATAFTVNAAIGQEECVPSKVAFGHWNNLAATVFDFTPNPQLTFTNPYNVQYLTADSAYALYFDAKNVTATQDTTVCATYYGVYSNQGVADTAKVSVNVVAEKRALELAEGNREYTQNGAFQIKTTINNFDDGAAVDYEKVLVAVYPAVGVTVYDDGGKPVDDVSYVKPYTRIYTDFQVSDIQETEWRFSADVGADSHYRKIEFRVFDISDDPTNGTSPELLVGNLLGSGSTMILCPGGDGKLPQVQFTSGSPEIIYNQGTRNLFFTGTNLGMLQLGVYDLVAVSRESGLEYPIPDDDVVLDESKGTAHVILSPEQELPVGGYRLEFRSDDESAPAGRTVSAPALAFTVSSDTKYKNEGYAIVAVVQDNQPSDPAQITYSIRAFPNEPAYETFLKEGKEVLFELRGAFELKWADESKTVITQAVAVSRSGSEPVVINNCFDLVDGSLTVYQANGEIKVDLDGELRTSGVGSPVWDGVAGFTAIKNGVDYQLRPYKYDGTRKTGGEGMGVKKPILLLWPSAAGLGQQLAGFIFNFEYAELGIIDGKESGDPKTMVAAYRAKLDLGFIIPSASRGDMAEYKLSPMEQLHLTLCSRKYTADELRTYRNDDKIAQEQEKSFGEPGLKVIVDDVLFGGGGFIGFAATVDIALPSYSPALPQMSGKLSINTIHNWAAGFQGKGKMMEMLEMEFELKIKGAPDSGAPVPDKLYFYIAGFTPGINVDGFGVLWIQGGGGGIDKLYDTIFGTSSLPPLTILLSVKVAILQIIQARADLSLSLRGVGVKLSEGKVAGIQVLNSAQLRFDWYPEFYFLAAVNVSILKIINGAGYIVVEDDGFFEFYLRVDISLPEDIPLVGGIQVAGADVGANSDKLWGNIYILGVGLGVTYYWGDHVSFSGIGQGSKPTYPELLALSNAPVYNDPVTGRVLYAAVGTNVQFLGAAGATLFANETPHSITIGDAVDRDEFALTLTAYDGTNAMISIDYPAEDAAGAEAVRSEITVDGYALKWLTTGTAEAPVYVDDPINVGTNAYYRGWNQDTGLASVTVTFSDAVAFGKAWTIHTPKGAEVGLYSVEPLPALTGLTTMVAENHATVQWTGTALDQFDSISFYAVDPEGEKDDLLVYRVEQAVADPTPVTGGSAAFDLPVTLPSGTYQLKAVASKSGEHNSVAETEETFRFENSALPAAPGGVTAANAGDHFIQVEVNPSEVGVDGYYVNVYEVGQDGGLSLADGSGMLHPADQGNAFLTGGQYQSADVYEDEVTGEIMVLETSSIRGLTAGNTYRVGVAAYREQPGGLCLFSGETLSDSLVLDQPIDTTFSITAAPAPVMVPQIGVDGETYHMPTYRVPTGPEEVLTLTLTADQAVTGTWFLDQGAGRLTDAGERLEAAASGRVDGAASIPIRLTDLAQGEHTLRFQGKNGQGDGCLWEYRFAVDATPPRLVVGAPLNGGFFDGAGSATVTGLTDPGAILGLSVNGTERPMDQPAIAPDGSFSMDVALDPNQAVQNLALTASDLAGNQERVEITLVNQAVAQIRSLAVYHGNTDVTNRQLGGRAATTAQLTLWGSLPDGSRLELTSHPLVEWEAIPTTGTASVDETGKAVIGANAKGIITARLPVADSGARVASTIFGEADTNSVQPGAPDPAVLESLLAQARGLNQSEYTAESWAVLAAAVSAAEAVLAKSEFTQQELNSAAQALRNAIQGLQRAGGSSTVGGGGSSTGDRGAVISVERPVATPREPLPPVRGVIHPSTEASRSGQVDVTITDQDIQAALELAKDEARRAGLEANGVAVAVDLTGLEDAFETLRLTVVQAAWERLAGAEITRLELRTDQISLWLDSKAVKAVHAAAKGDVILTAVHMNAAKLPAGAHAFEGRPVYDLALASGGNAITSFGEGCGTLFLPCALSAGEQGARLQMALLESDGQPDYLKESYYDRRQAAMEGRTGRLGIFGVASRPVPEFTDIQGHWGRESILAAASYGLLNGTGGGAFTPNGTMTRGMFVTALYRLAGFPQAAGEQIAFTDVPADTYYTQAVAWASSRGVVKGTGAGAFEPDRPVTRQEMAVIMTGYAKAMEVPMPELYEATPFADGGQIAAWATEAVEAMQRSGILNGKDGELFDPASTATRAEAAAVLCRYVELVDSQVK